MPKFLLHHSSLSLATPRRPRRHPTARAYPAGYTHQPRWHAGADVASLGCGYRTSSWASADPPHAGRAADPPTPCIIKPLHAGAPAHDGRPPALWLRQCSCVTGAGPLPSLQLTRMSAAELKQAGDGAMSGKARPPVQLLRRSNPVRMAVDETVILLTLSLHHY